MSQALYRKYRSRSFDDVIGQRHVTDLLQAAVKQGAVSHAYLFTGPRGTGKTSVARIMAHAINELPYTDDATHLDIIEIDAASNRRIDDVRDLREKVHITPTSARYKVYIIDEVHMLTGESFNALLKTLEEPPEHAIFILATTELHKVPATIVSRTQRFHFRPGATKDVVAHLRTIAEQENIAIDDDALELIAEHSEGGFRDSVSLLDQVSHLSDQTISRQTVEDLLGLAPGAQIETVIDSLVQRDPSAIGIIQSLLHDGVSAVTIADQLIRQLPARAAEAPALYPLLGSLLEVPRSYAPAMKLIALVAASVSIGQSTTTPPSAPVATKKAPSATPAAAPIIRDEPEQSVKQPTAAPEKPVQKPAPTPSETPAIVWADIMTELQKHTPALYAIVKRAQADVTPTEIRLSFAYALHRKKMNDPKSREQLAKVVTALYGHSPDIVVEASAAKPLDKAAADVADIMGGGEAVIV